jgi:2-dehydro-3-deoxy-D-arabinonate dehydratase
VRRLSAKSSGALTNLAAYLFRSQTFPHGVVLLTGTGIVPPDNVTLQAADVVRISISGIGVLENTVAIV